MAISNFVKYNTSCPDFLRLHPLHDRSHLAFPVLKGDIFLCHTIHSLQILSIQRLASSDKSVSFSLPPSLPPTVFLNPLPHP